MSVHLLVATIPRRRGPCERLLAELERQSVRPDRLELVLDGYGEAPGPVVPSSLPVREWRTPRSSGPGQRWRVAHSLEARDLVVCLDDDVHAGNPRLVELLVAGAGEDGAAAGWGTMIGGRFTPKRQAHEDLVCIGTGACAVRVGALGGLEDLAARVRARFRFDCLGDCGDDEALVSALLWSKGVAMRHVFLDGVSMAPGTQGPECQTARRRARDGSWDRQRRAIAAVTGWPWHPVESAVTTAMVGRRR